MKESNRKRTAILLPILVTVFVIALALERPSHIEKFELSINDIIYSLGIERGNLDDVVIVAIDNSSISEVGRWPWHRDKLAELISGIAVRNPKVIGLDILLQRDFEEDTLGATGRLASAIEAAGNVVAPFYFALSQKDETVDEEIPDFIYHNSYLLFDNPMTIGVYPIPRAKELFAPTYQIGQTAAALGYVNVAPDIDGKVRWEPLVISHKSHYFPSFAMQVARLFLDISPGGIKLIGGEGLLLGSEEIKTDAAMRIPIKYSGEYNTFKYISALDIFEGNVAPNALTGKAVLVGYAAADNRDVAATPLTEVLPGVEKQANVVENLINNNVLKGIKASAWGNIFIIILFGAIGAYALPRIQLHHRLFVILGSLFLLFNVEYFIFANYEIMLQFFYPALELVIFLAISPLFAINDVGISKTSNKKVLDGESSRTIPIPNVNPTNRESDTAEKTIVTQSARNLDKMGRYEIESVLGKGAMGTVYKGVDPAIGRPVAIKTIRLDRLDSDEESGEMLKRLNQEAHSAGRLSHPNIITIYDVGIERNLHYIAMEFLEGVTLEKMLKERKILDFYTAACALKQTADALAYAHRNNVIHRDIKPANIMVLPDDVVKVMDFGIARTDNMHLTQTGITVGTPNYISPEQLKGGAVDGRADIFSAGVMLYECITGAKPFKGDNISSLVVSILHTDPAAPSRINPDIPGELDALTMKALEKNPDNRYGDATEFANCLRAFLGESVPAVDNGDAKKAGTTK